MIGGKISIKKRTKFLPGTAMYRDCNRMQWVNTIGHAHYDHAFVKRLPKEIALLKPSVTRKHTHSARVASSHVENESGNETILARHSTVMVIQLQQQFNNNISHYHLGTPPISKVVKPNYLSN